MKHHDLIDALIQMASPVYPVTEERARQLLLHLQLVLEANAHLNLTRITDVNEAVRKHVLDSLTVAGVQEGCPEGELADLGSGAGYPGIPLAIVMERPVTLVESIAKKAAFLEGAVETLGLRNVAVAPIRAEQLARQRPNEYAVVVARALSSLPSLAELAAPLLVQGGCLIAMKARLEDDEVHRGEQAGRIVGLKLEEIRSKSIPGADERNLVIFRAVAGPRIALPRREGLAQRRPLA